MQEKDCSVTGCAFHTTEEFAWSGKKHYRSNCGPTAITNLLCTLAMTSRYPALQGLPAQQIFRTVVRIGQRSLLYWNCSLFHRFGGTFIFAMKPYLTACLKHYGVPADDVYTRLFTTPAKAAKALDEGYIILIAMLFQKKYGSHMVLGYGWTRYGQKGRRALKIADGWSSGPVYLPFSQVRVLGFCGVRIPQISRPAHPEDRMLRTYEK